MNMQDKYDQIIERLDKIINMLSATKAKPPGKDKLAGTNYRPSTDEHVETLARLLAGKNKGNQHMMMLGRKLAKNFMDPGWRQANEPEVSVFEHQFGKAFWE